MLPFCKITKDDIEHKVAAVDAIYKTDGHPNIITILRFETLLSLGPTITVSKWNSATLIWKTILVVTVR